MLSRVAGACQSAAGSGATCRNGGPCSTVVVMARCCPDPNPPLVVGAGGTGLGTADGGQTVRSIFSHRYRSSAMLTATSIRAWPSLSGTIAGRRSGESPRTGTVSSNEAIHCATPPLSAMLTRISEAPAGSGDSAHPWRRPPTWWPGPRWVSRSAGSPGGLQRCSPGAASRPGTPACTSAVQTARPPGSFPVHRSKC